MVGGGCIIPAHSFYRSMLTKNDLKYEATLSPSPRKTLHMHQDKMHISDFWAEAGTFLSWFTMTTQAYLRHFCEAECQQADCLGKHVQVQGEDHLHRKAELNN